MKKERDSELPTRIRTLRKSVKWSQEKMAEVVDVSMTTMQGWESGRKSPSTDSIEKIANILWANRNLTWFGDSDAWDSFWVHGGEKLKNSDSYICILKSEREIREYIETGVAHFDEKNRPDEDELYDRYMTARHATILMGFDQSSPEEIMYLYSLFPQNELKEVFNPDKFLKYMNKKAREAYQYYIQHENGEE
jgi:transcriptional regulator with XRE-family HTH domain